MTALTLRWSCRGLEVVSVQATASSTISQLSAIAWQLWVSLQGGRLLLIEARRLTHPLPQELLSTHARLHDRGMRSFLLLHDATGKDGVLEPMHAPKQQHFI